MIFSHFKSL